MIDFLAEAAVLVGLLTYARKWRDQPEPEEPDASEEPVAEPKRRAPARPSEKPPEPEAERPAASVFEQVAGAAASVWSKLESWLPEGGEDKGSAKPRKPEATGGWSDSPAGKPLWSGPSPFKAPSRPAPDAGSAAARPAAPANGGAPPAAAAGARPSSVRCPTCGTELPWARAVSLRVGAEALYFCSTACKTLYSKGQGHD